MLSHQPQAPRAKRQEQSGKLRLTTLFALCGLIVASSALLFFTQTRATAKSNDFHTTNSGLSLSWLSNPRPYGNKPDIFGEVMTAYAGRLTASASANPFTSNFVYHEQTVVAVAASTSTTVTVDDSSIDAGMLATFTANVTSGTPGTITGTVQFKENSNNFGSPATLSGGQAQLATRCLTVGSHTISADYSGDSNYAASSGTMLGLESISAPPAVVVDDSFAGSSDCQDLGASGLVSAGTLVFGRNAFATIAAGQVGVTPTGTVYVNAGTYAENVTVAAGQVLTLEGDVVINDLTLNGTLDVGTHTLTLNGAVSGTGFLISAATGTVNYNQSSNGQNVLAANYGNLTFSNFNKTLASSGTIGIAGTFTPGTASGHSTNFSTIEFNGTSSQTVPVFPTYYNLALFNTAGTNGAAGLKVNNTLTVQAGTFNSASDYHHVVINGTLSLSGNVTVSGNWTNNGTFNHNTFSVTFDGDAANQTIGGSSSTAFALLQINNSAPTNNNIVALDASSGATTPSASSVNVLDGVFDQGTGSPGADFSSGAVSVSMGATWQNFGVGDVILSGNVSNGGTINFNANGTACGNNDDILIRSSDNATQRGWSGTGTFSMTDVDVKHQKAPTLLPPPATILVNSGTDGAPGGTNTGWVFANNCTAGTYTWIGGTLGAATDWQVPTNWNPTRAPAVGDRLIFDGNQNSFTPTFTVTNVPTETIASLTLTNSVNATQGVVVNLSTSATNTLTIAGASPNDLAVPANTRLELSGSNALTISLTNAGNVATIGGRINFFNGAHKLTGANAGQILFGSGSIFAAGDSSDTGFNGHPFGSGVSDSVRFQDGSQSFFNEGNDPFGGPSFAVATFTQLSTAEFSAANAFSFRGRSYGTVTLTGNQVYFDAGATSQTTIMGNLTIASGSTLKLSDLAGGDLNLWGNFTDNGIFDPNGRTVKFQGGGATQTISKSSGTETFFDVFIAKTTGGLVQLLTPLTINGALTFGSGGTPVDVLELNAQTLTLNGTVGAVPNASSGLKGDLLGSSLVITTPATVGTVHFIPGAESVSSLVVNGNPTNTLVSFDTDLRIGRTNAGTPALALTNGVADMSGSTTLIVDANVSVSRTAGCIFGNEQRKVNCTSGNCSAITFDVCHGGGYAPVDVTSTVTVDGEYSQIVKAVFGQHPNITGANALQGYWTLSAITGPGTATANVTFHYNDGMVPGTANESNFKIFRYNGSFTQFEPTTLDTGANFATLNGVTQFSDWTLAEAAAVEEGTLQFSAANFNDSETNADHTATITVTRTLGTDGAVSVQWATSAGSATAATDYIEANGVLNWADNEGGSKTFTVTVKGDTGFEPDETVNLTLSVPTGGATIGSPNPATLTIQNDDPAPCIPPATVYVDDNFANPTPGADPDGGGPATNFGCDSFATVQGGVNGVAAGGTVLVYAGTYNEDVLINNAGLQLLGTDAGTKTISGPMGGSATTLQIASSNVTVAGFTITRGGNNTTDWSNNLNTAGIAIQGSTTGVLIRDNIFTGNRTAIDINNSGGHTVRNNTIDFNRTGMIFRNQTDNMTVVENFITNNWTVGVLFLDASDGTNSPLQQALNSTFSNNSISGNWYGQIVDRQSGGSIPAPGTTNLKNFSGNWFGTNAPVVTTANSAEPGYDVQIPTTYGGSASPPGGQPDIAGSASANFDYTPYLDVGTDTNVETVVGRGTNGFQGSFSVLHVVATDAQTGAVGRIQEGVNSVTSGGTLHIHAGSYTENVNATSNSVVLAPGASPGQVTINGSFALDGNDTVAIEINGTTPGSGFDQFVVNGTVTLGGAALNVSGTYTPTIGDSFIIISNNGGAVGGIFNGLPEGTLVNVNGTNKRITYVGGDGNDVELAAITADLTLTKTDSADPVTEGNTFSYTLTVANAGPDTATNVVLTDTLPGGVTFVSSTASQGSCSGTSTVTCNLGTINNGGNATVQIEVTANSPGTLINNGSATATEFDPTPATDSENTLVIAATCSSPPFGLVAWYPGDRNAHDVVAARHGNLVNGTTFGSGKVGAAFSFDGTDDYVDIPNVSSLNFGSGDFTIDLWFNLDSVATDQTFVHKSVTTYDSGVTGEAQFLLEFNSSNALRFRIAENGANFNDLSVPTSIVAGRWYHVAAVRAGNTNTLYLNGTVIGSQTAGVSADTGLGGTAAIGRLINFAPPSARNVDGRLDEIEFFNTALSAGDIGGIYNASFAGKCHACATPPANLKNWWDGSGTGTTANDIAGTNPGTLQGGATFGPGRVGQGFVFTGAPGDVVSVPYASGFPSSANGFTVDAWINLDSFDSADGIFSAVNTGGGGGANDIRVRLMTVQDGPGGGLYAQVRRPTGGAYDVDVTSGQVLLPNTWHHVAMTAAPNSQIKVYVDGVIVAISGDNVGASLPTDVNRVFIGSGEQATVFNVDGSIDEVELFTRVLSDAEVAAIADAGNSGKCHTSSLQFSSPTYTVAENIGSGNATITVTRTGALDGTVSVNYATVAGGSATAGTGSCGAGDDYVSTSGMLTFNPNQTSKTFTVAICNDSTFEANETINLQLNTPSVGATIGTPSSAVLTITNNEDAPQISINDVTLAEGNSGTTNFVFTVTKTGSTELTATVNYTTVNGTATGGVACGSGTDYETTAGSLSFDPNETTKTITVPVCGDTDVENDEFFLVSLSGGTNRVITDFTGDGNIINDDTAVTLAVSPAAVFEDSTPNLVFTFTRNLTTDPLTVNFSIGGTATFGSNPGDDYTQSGATTFTPPTGTVTFGVGVSTVTVTVDPTADATDEDDETVILTLASGTGYSIGTPGPVTGTIRDNDAAPTTLIIRQTNLQGWQQQHAHCGPGSSTGAQNFVIGPATPPLGEGSLQYLIGADGDSFETLRNPNLDTVRIDELSNLRYSTYVTSPGGQAPYLLLNIDFNGDTTFDDQIFFEPVYQSAAFFPSNPQGPLTTATWQTWDALNGGWWSLNGIAGAGQGTNVKSLAQYLAVQPNARIINASGDGGFRIATGCGGGAWVNFDGNADNVLIGVGATNTLYDMEPLPRISIDNVTAPEGNAGPTTFTFNVTLSGPSDQTIMVGYTTTDNTAKASDSDYQTKTDTVTFNPGETSKPITITVNGDTKLEPDETFFVDLSSPINAVITTARGIGTIQNDDNATSPTFAIDNVTMAEGNAGTTNFVFTVTKTGVTGIRSRVDFATADGTTNPALGGATCGGAVDYVSQTGTLTFNPSETTKQITIPVCGETLVEPDDTFFVNLSNAVNATITSGQGTGTITNDDLLIVDDDLVQCPNAGFQTIQAAINFASAGQTIQVCAGTYPEQIEITKQLTLLGPNANINPNTGVRVAEATIIPTASDPLNGSFAGPIVVSFGDNGTTFVGTNGITFKGFTVDGDNPSLTSGVVFNGADVDAEFGIYGTETANPDAVIENNIVKNIGEIAVWLNSNGQGGAKNANSRITNNKVDNNLGVFGQGIRISDDAWLDVTNNVVTRVRNGIVIENYSGNTTTHPASVIENNNVTSFRIGIRHNLHYVYTAPGFTIRNNVVQSYAQTPMPSQVTTPTAYQGIRVESIQQTVEVDVTNNTVDGNRTALQGIGYTRVEGLNVTNASATSPNIRFTGNRVFDSLRGVFHETPAVPTFTCNNIVGNTIGILVDPAATNGLIANNNNIFGNGVGLQNDSPAATLNAENNYWGSATGPTIASNPTGTGDSITGTNAAAVDYNPFLASAASCAAPAPPTISKSFGASSVALNGTTSLSFTLTNPNASTLTGVGFNDALPAGLVVATPNGLSGSCGGGTINAVAGSGNISLSGATLTASASCTFSVDVEGTTAGIKNNTTDNVTSTEGGSGGTASATLVVNPPTITIDDVTMAEGNGGTTTFTFTVSLSNTFPTNVTVDYTTVPGTTNPATEGTCGGTDDYQDASGTATITANTLTTTIAVTVCGDTALEPNETFFVNLSNNSPHSTMAAGTKGTGTITNDDSVCGNGIVETPNENCDDGNAIGGDGCSATCQQENFVTVAVSPAAVTENGATDLVYTFTRTVATGPQTINFLVSATATLNTDYTVTGADTFTATNGTVTFTGTNTTATVTVNPSPDTTPELDETVQLTVDSGSGYFVGSPSTAAGTITNDDESVTAGQLIISEFRLSGPGANPTAQANNEFIEIYNTTDQDVFVTTTDSSAGWAVATSNGVAVFNIPNGTTIPARGHFLGTNTTGYSLKDYGGTDAALGNATWITDVPDNSALALFRTNNAANFNSGNRLDSVGPNTESNPLYKEGTGYAPLGTPFLEHTFFRQICVFQAGCPTPGRPRDTQDNAADFIFADTLGTATSSGERLGSPGPENLASPIKRDPAVNLVLLDATVAEPSAPNRDRNTTPDSANASQFGTMTIRRRVVNQTGSTVTRLRFRIIDMTTHPSGVFADLRLRSSSSETINGINDANTCGGTGTPTTPPCQVTVNALTLEQPPNVPAANGAGLNSTVTVTLLGGGLTNGQSINVNFLLGVQKTGQFRFYLVIEALP